MFFNIVRTDLDSFVKVDIFIILWPDFIYVSKMFQADSRFETVAFRDATRKPRPLLRYYKFISL